MRSSSGDNLPRENIPSSPPLAAVNGHSESRMATSLNLASSLPISAFHSSTFILASSMVISVPAASMQCDILATRWSAICLRFSNGFHDRAIIGMRELWEEIQVGRARSRMPNV
eukprot:CAMPEP_0119313454 /NCGR_PEP_ID=MMETSP1333-20130426/29160_1 /TAXON_ID=418940 /ORGANISM="Scyphosphaera apsteinii, Strain RCC1455" /LENGTH=113 /DNA_ID=CAMNT_0007318293 /DNA_START=262 /DNA_END=603 /DNA_ORIENTATION=+